jgi:hypothetical protein
MILCFTVEDLAHLFHVNKDTMQHHMSKLVLSTPSLKPLGKRPQLWTWEQAQIIKLHFKHNPIQNGKPGPIAGNEFTNSDPHNYSNWIRIFH